MQIVSAPGPSSGGPGTTPPAGSTAAALARRTLRGAPVVLASRNRGKLVEFDALCAGILNLEAWPPDVPVPEVLEDGATFLDNALVKARTFALACGSTALADDSGLEVDALGGAPGVGSARYGGAGLDDGARSSLLLEALAGVENRRARFRCVVVLHAARPGDAWFSAAGTLEGAIGCAPRGAAGFGYDPVFVPEGCGGRTLAELAPATKNAISHRALALRALLDMLRAAREGGR